MAPLTTPSAQLFAPVKPEAVNRQTGLIGMSWVLSDDAHFALVEFVARTRSAVPSIQGALLARASASPKRVPQAQSELRL